MSYQINRVDIDQGEFTLSASIDNQLVLTLIEGKDWIKVDDKFKTKVDAVYSGGDNTHLGLVIDAIAHGQRAALAIHELIAGEEMPPAVPNQTLILSEKMQLGFTRSIRK